MAFTSVLWASCEGDSSPPLAASATGAVATAIPSETPPPSLGAQIGERAGLPDADPIDLAARYGLTDGRVPAAKPFAGEANVGESRSFNVTLISGAAISGAAPPVIASVTATLQAKSAHAYFYVDNALSVDAADVRAGADAFETTTWPKVTAVFGEPPAPGVDGDPRIIVLQADLGGAVGGYHSGDDRYPREVRPLSNEAEMVYMDRTLRAGGGAFNVVLAHEFQHLIHAGNDEGEEAWVNEGLSEAASGLVGGALSSISSFEAKPATQLNRWASQGSLPHYGAGAAFFGYLADRFGGDAELGKIARQPGDGAAGVDEYLAQAPGALKFRDIFADFMVANVLNRSDGPYGRPSRPLDMRFIGTLGAGDSENETMTQFGTDYYSLDVAGGQHTLRIKGAPVVPVLPVEIPPGGSVLWSNAGDSSDTALTREVDLTAAAAPVLTFRAWYDIERWYDWGYVAASTDGGATWKALAGETTSSDDPVRQAYGPGFTGNSASGPQWVNERIDLAPYAGQRILLRFEYVTDGATHGEGWAIDAVAVDGVPISNDDPGWATAGWVRIAEQLPQTYIVRVIGERAAGEPFVLDVPVAPSGEGELTFNADGLTGIVLAVAGSTEGTGQESAYRIELDPP